MAVTGGAASGKGVATLATPSLAEDSPEKLASSLPSSSDPRETLVTPRHVSVMESQRAGSTHRATVKGTVLDSGRSRCRPELPYVLCNWEPIPGRSSAISSSANGETTTMLVMKCGDWNNQSERPQ